MNRYKKNFGIFVLCVSILLAVVVLCTKESNKPVSVTSYANGKVIGSGSMGGWSQKTQNMFNNLLILAGVGAVIGIVLISTSGHEEHSENEGTEEETKTAMATIIAAEKVYGNGAQEKQGTQVVFETADGKRMRLFYHGDIPVARGGQGQLTWRGENVLNFVPQAPYMSN